MYQPAVLALEDGRIFTGRSIGSEGSTAGEVVFNTSMTGYQEILTDPSYARQIVTLTYPHIGNVGINDEDSESDRVWAAGLVIRDLSPIMSSWRAQKTLQQFLQEQGIVAIADVDTRALTRHLRDHGAMGGCIFVGDDASRAVALAKDFPGLKGMDLAREVTTSKPYSWKQGTWQIERGFEDETERAFPWHVVAYDFGVKRNILRMLAERGCRVTVVPAQTPASEVLALRPDGVFLSNGPGDPEPCDYAIEAIRTLMHHRLPMFGICLGHQLLSLACGGKTMKMKFGHHGGNHPVKDLRQDKVLITSQNHGFAVDEKSLPDVLEVTHRSLFDGTIQGVRHKDTPAFGFQGHPEASPGPHDVAGLFDEFVELMQAHRKS